MSKSTKSSLSRQATDRDPLLHAAHPTSTSTSTSTPTSLAITSTGTKNAYQTDDVALDMSNARLSSLKEASQSKPHKRTKKRSIGGAGLLWLLIRVVFHLTLLGVHGYMVYVAQHYADEDCERRLDQWAWLQGVGILSLSTIYVARAFIEDRISESWDTFCFRFSWCFNIIATITALAWTILGSVWTFSIDPNTLVCPRHLYDICWYYLISVWGILASCVAIMLCLACIFCIKLRK